MKDYDPPRYVIVSARVAPMVELARWLFERAAIPYEEEGHAPLIHAVFTRRRRGGVEVPVVVSAAATWKGARETLKETDVVICEIDLAEFHHLDLVMRDESFSLFDMTELRRLPDQSLSWFYPIYLNRRQDRIRSRTLWDPSMDQAAMEMQRKRREQVLEYNAHILQEIRKARGGT